MKSLNKTLQNKIAKLLKTAAATILIASLSACGADSLENSQNSQNMSSLNSVFSEANYKKDPKWHYTFAQWCKYEVPDMTEAEEYTMFKLTDEITRRGAEGDCDDAQKFLEESNTKVYSLAGEGVLDLSPLISLKDAKNMGALTMHGQWIDQEEVDKLDFIDDYLADSFKILTLPRSKGKDSKCPLKKLKKACR